MMYDAIVIGGGAAGFYGAIHLAKHRPNDKIAILEQGKNVLGKVKISGGGRCNVTHAQFNPDALAQNYPRGGKELLGPFYSHHPEHIIQFFKERGIPLKTEADGRMFPISDSSQTIIDCFMDAIAELEVELIRNSMVMNIICSSKSSDDQNLWEVQTKSGSYFAKKILIATGSNQKMWNILKRLGHNIIEPVPSLFTFNIKDPRLEGIPGISTKARVQIVPENGQKKNSPSSSIFKKVGPESTSSEGPVLVTHWGLSGPAILKLSAWGARLFNHLEYQFNIRINWVPEYHLEGMYSYLQEVKEIEAKKTVYRSHPIEIPKRLWAKLVKAADISTESNWADISNKKLLELARELTMGEFQVNGKSTFKEEFVTAGGVDLKEVNFKTFESKKLKGIFFAGEVLNIDAVTGGFNFQNAWTSAFMAALAMTD